MKWRAGILAALVTAVGCHAGSSSFVGSTSVVVSGGAPGAGDGRPRVARLFAAGSGTCRVQWPGQVRCWGAVPAGLVETAKANSASSVAFVNERTGSPYCVLDDAGKATCAVGCAPEQPGCPAVFQSVSAVHAMWPLSPGMVVLVKRDGTGCSVRDGKVQCADAVATVVEMGADDRETQVDLRHMFAVAYQALVGPGWMYCRMILDNQGRFRCGEEREGHPDVESVRALLESVAVDASGSVFVREEFENDGETVVYGTRQVPRLEAMSAVVETSSLTCAYASRGPVFCWGKSSDSEHPQWKDAFSLGNEPSAVAGLDCVDHLVSGDRHVCAQSCDDRTYCWGDNRDGQLAALPEAVTSQVVDLPPALEVAAGSDFSCALGGDAAVWCWGNWSDRHLGGAPRGRISSRPVRVPLPARARAISAGTDAMCAILQSGAVACWGRNENLLTVPSEAILSIDPTLVRGIDNPDEVEVGNWQACARVRGEVHCWGSNELGQLGLGHEQPVAGVVRVPGIERAVDIDVSNASSCAALADGRVTCWGYMVAPSGERELRPHVVPGVNDAVAVFVADDGLCVLNARGEARCRDKEKKPLSTVWNGGVRRIAAMTGSNHEGFCALHGAAVGCWGKLGTSHHVLKPLLEGMHDLRSLALGDEHACAVRADGAVVCVGDDHSGQLGTGRLLASTTPVLVE